MELVAAGQLPENFAGAANLQAMGERLASNPTQRWTAAQAVISKYVCETNPTQCAVRAGVAVVAPVLMLAGAPVLTASLPAIAAAATMTLDACLASPVLCINRAGAVAADITASDALGGASLSSGVLAARKLATVTAEEIAQAARNAATVAEEVAAVKRIDRVSNTLNSTSDGTEAVGATNLSSKLDWSRNSPRTGGDAAHHVVLNHGSLNLAKPDQGVFYGNPISVAEDAWAIAQKNGVQPVTIGTRDIYVIERPNSGYSGGYSGQQKNLDYVTLITEIGSNRVVTAFPSGGTPPIPKGYKFTIGD